jgi:asparagine synthetase B (glutamine-hydrolysing)
MCTASSMANSTATKPSAPSSPLKTCGSQPTPIARSRFHLYEKHGAEFVHHLSGEFAIVIADERRRCLIAARDRFGIKPLFYTVVNGAVLLASEVKALFALGAPPRCDEDGFLADCHYTRQANQSRSTRTERFELLNPETRGRPLAKA